MHKIKNVFGIIVLYVIVQSQGARPQGKFMEVPDKIVSNWIPVDITFKESYKDVPPHTKDKYEQGLKQITDFIMSMLEDIEAELKVEPPEQIAIDYADYDTKEREELKKQQKIWKEKEKYQPSDPTFFFRKPKKQY